jgi:hypothetical protein
MLSPRTSRKKTRLPKVFWLFMVAALIGVIAAHLFYSPAQEHAEAITYAVTVSSTTTGSKSEGKPKNN